MSLFEWIFNNLYVVAVIAFALFSVLGKLGKSANPNQKRPGNGMPTFGGGEDANRRSGNDSSQQQSAGHDDRRYEEQYDERYDDGRYDDERYDERYDQPYSEPATSSSSGDEFRGDQSLDSMRSSVDEQMRLMEEQQRMIQDRLNRISSATSPSVSNSSMEDVDTTDSVPSRLRQEDIRTGVLWAEVLGSPRSKQPFGTRGKL
ncbi:hypothetical protein SAMN05720606_10134 [Paenibacillus polysaccharolyticus]|uniref:Uncharacterized protein n=1 Tax=Paenibacillus polysaccharolyticus TaxID=582692 RepID=A0A1G5ANX0_9BACL|nr:hypothetical protein [Paenibacillus polysaccharolyticus]SCX79613.1 hypothetical protein SAMN05720606_10134 [Paenibacillus polysaccharolyticus]